MLHHGVQVTGMDCGRVKPSAIHSFWLRMMRSEGSAAWVEFLRRIRAVDIACDGVLLCQISSEFAHQFVATARSIQNLMVSTFAASTATPDVFCRLETAIAVGGG